MQTLKIYKDDHDVKIREKESLLLNKNMETKAHHLLIIVPAFNEEGNIQKTVDDISSIKFSESLNIKKCSILIINDGSKDNTLRQAQETDAMIISHPINLGIGAAVQTGFKFAEKKGYDIVVQVDGDGQHDVSYLEPLIEPIINGQMDMTIGSRFIEPFLGYRSSFIRRIGIHFFAYLLSFLTNYEVTDPTSGFRGFNKKMIGIFSHRYPQDFPEPEAIAVAGKYAARIKEVPVVMRKRAAGHSSIRYLKTLYYMVKVTFAIILVKLRRTKGFK